MSTLERRIVLVTRKTRLEELIARFHTADQARFYVQHLGADFGEYEREHATYLQAKATVLHTLELHGRYQQIERQYLPNYLFGEQDVVIGLGQDGLIANTIKYLRGQPLLGINPDPKRYDGVLLPFAPAELALVLPEVLASRRVEKTVTMAQATVQGGQSMLAVNDLFIGPRTHTSARYELMWNGKVETQSSSGVIVSTGLGSTGWMTSIVTGALGIEAAWNRTAQHGHYKALPWDADTLRFAVREPFPSRASRAALVYGDVNAKHPLRVVSHMPENGVIFSDGIESDYIEFNAGLTATIQPAVERGRLIV